MSKNQNSAQVKASFVDAIVMPRFYDYNTWVKRHPEIEEEEIECDNCNGTGEEECWHCGNTVECEDCEGTGKILSKKQIYLQQKKLDEARLHNGILKVA